MRQLLVTGGTGFIGQALVRHLLERGYQIYVWTRHAQRWQAKNSAQLHYFSDLDSLPEALDLYGVINLAGESLDAKRWNAKQKQILIDSRVKTTEQLTHWLMQRQATLKVWVNGSAVGWYGPQSDQPLDETSAPVESFSHQLCKQWEEAAAKAAQCSERLVLVRIGIVLEADGGPLAAMLLPYRLGLGGKLGSGEQVWSWIHRLDLIRLIEWSLEHSHISGPVNAAAPQALPQADFARALAKTLRRPCFAHMPAGIAKLILGEFAEEILLKGQRAVPSKVNTAGFEFKFPELRAALNAILT